METRNTRWTGILNSSENRKRGALKAKETKARKTTGVLRNVLIRFFLSGSVLSRKCWSRIIPKEWKLLVACSESMHRVTTVVSGRSVKCNAIFATFESFRLDLKRCCYSVVDLFSRVDTSHFQLVPIYGNTMLRYEQQTLTTLFWFPGRKKYWILRLFN